MSIFSDKSTLQILAFLGGIVGVIVIVVAGFFLMRTAAPPPAPLAGGTGTEGPQELAWLDGYSGQTVDELLALESTHRVASLVLAFDQAISKKVGSDGFKQLTREERVVLAVENLERLVNNGGYESFLEECPYSLVQVIVDALRQIGCAKTAEMTREAIAAVPEQYLKDQNIFSFTSENKKAKATLAACDDRYFKNDEGNDEGIARRLFQFIEANRARISF